MADNSKVSYYEDKNYKASEIKNSAIALIIVGVASLVLVVLVFLNIIDLKMSVAWRNISCSFMGIFCLFLIVTGFLSIKTFKITLKLAKEEDELSIEIEKWYKANLTVEKLDKILQDSLPDYDSLEDTDMYFYRTAIIRKLLKDTFMNLDEKYMEHMAEIIYTDIFENDD